ncbi:MAG: hypothetical protein CME06_08725, partial [Gemmatimonadetes bacterium]|nr:hypothetical protein [Gemmatimonadota bacterium]
FYFKTHGGEPTLYTYNAPYDARHWFPSWDLPGDKATSRITVRAREDHHVYANGALVGVTPPQGGVRTWVWEESNAIATYLISVTIGPYATLLDTVEVDGIDVPIHHEVFPEDTTKARFDFEHVGEMLRFFAIDTSEPYPFDKYGYSEVPGLGGAMEDQSCVTIGSPLITGTRAYEDVVAHEAAHMWFGDLVTPEDFRSVWLNEGFATYWDALFSKHYYGDDAFRDRLLEFRRRDGPLWDSTPIFDPPLARIYSSIEYEKAALVLHMLRYVIGEPAFADAIAAHVDAGRYGHATTDSFQAHCEAAAGTDLQWFFDQWIYAAGKPSYLWSWRETEPGRFALRVEQSEAPLFHMPLPFTAHGAWGSDELRIEVPAEPVVEIDFALPGALDSLRFDPDLWMLCDAEQQPWTGIGGAESDPKELVALLGAPSPNPFNPRVALPLDLTKAQSLRLAVYDTRGALVATLFDGRLGAGRHLVRWDGRNERGRPAATGVYHVRLDTANGRSRTTIVLLR